MEQEDPVSKTEGIFIFFITFFFCLSLIFGFSLWVNAQRLNTISQKFKQKNEKVIDLKDKMHDLKKRNGFWKNDNWYRCIEYKETDIVNFIRKEELYENTTRD